MAGWNMGFGVIVLLGVLPAACSSGEGGTDSGGPTGLLDGILMDPYVDDAPIDGAWVVLDTGSELLSTRSAADGTFSIDMVPLDQPLTITFAAPDRVALTRTGFLLEEQTLPMEVRTCIYRSMDFYDLGTITVSGTFEGAPDGSYVLFYGENGYHGYSKASGEGPVSFGFEAELYPGAHSYTFSAVALNGSNYDIEGVAVATVQDGDEPSLTLSSDFTPLTVSTNQPSIDGQAVTQIESSNCISTAYTHPTELWAVVSGWTRSCETTEDGFLLSIPFLEQDLGTRVAVSLFNDLDSAAFAYVDSPVNGEQVELSLLDSPIPDTHGTFEPGTSISWTQVDGADDYYLRVVEDDLAAWYLMADSGTAIAFPAFPDDFDNSMIMETGNWELAARHGEWDDDGNFDYASTYQVSVTEGGLVRF